MNIERPAQKTKGRSGPVDKFVALKIREIRTANEQSRKALAEFLGVSYQQVQKYENGSSSIMAGTLLKIALFLDVPIQELFHGAPTSEDIVSYDAPSESEYQAFMRNPENVRLVASFVHIGDLKLRRKCFELMAELAALTDESIPTGEIR